MFSIKTKNREDVDKIVEAMNEIIKRFGNITVSDVRELTGGFPTYIDESLIWTSLVDADIRQVHDGYVLQLPDPKNRNA